MRVSFSTRLVPQSGKQNFAVLLAKAFARKGIIVTDKKPHVNLVFVKGVRRGCKNILRLDGAWMNSSMNYKAKNKKILSTMNKCDAVIYQSKYSRKVCEKFIGKSKKYKIIYNGCDPAVFRETYCHPKPYILACSRWRPHKRLSTIIEGFDLSGLASDYDLIVCGETSTSLHHPSIHLVGKRNVRDTYRLTAGCAFVAHLAYLDCCPNSVVESLVAGKQVLFARSGGTPELVANDGFGVEDKKYNFKAIELYSPPRLSLDEIVTGFKLLAHNTEHIYRPDLYIDVIAEQYIEFMNFIIDG